MLIATPPTTPALSKRIAALDELHGRLGEEIAKPGAWVGTLRRLVRAIAVESSTAIEGFRVPADETIGLVTGTVAPPPDDANRMAVASYARAMDHVAVMAGDSGFRWLDRVILDLHFDACRFQRDKRPGRWREGQVGIARGDGRLVYLAPDAHEVPGLMQEVVDWLQDGDANAHVVIRAAMAHLHVAAVHPFADGNGRVARIVQSLVLARDGILAPEFASIEEFLGAHTSDYYAVLRRVNGPQYRPEADARPWIDFCVTAHLDQARRRLAEIEAAGARWARLETLVRDRGWPDRLVGALERSLDGPLDRAGYAGDAGIAAVTASQDLRRLSDAGLLVARGQGRAVRYEPSDALRVAAAGES
jgi:Fic family protein